jgi:hypothetical protein
MFDDITKEIKAQLYDRARSPLFGGFVFAWVAWNFPSVLAILSDMPFSEKLEFWAKFYGGEWESLSRLFLYPLGSAILFIAVYPFPARWTFHYWHWQHTKLKAIQQNIEDSTPMTQEEVKELRKITLEQQTRMQEQLRSVTTINQELSAQRQALVEQLAEAQAANAKVQNQMNEMRDKLTIRASPDEGRGNATMDSRTNGEDDQSNERSTADNAPRHKIPQLVAKKLRENNSMDDVQMAIFNLLIQHKGSLETREILGELSWKQLEMEVAIDALAKKQLIRVLSTIVMLTDTGKAAALSAGLSY